MPSDELISLSKKPFLTSSSGLRVSGGKSTSIRAAGKPGLKKPVSRFKSDLPDNLFSATDYTDFHRKKSAFFLIRVICGLVNTNCDTTSKNGIKQSSFLKNEVNGKDQ